MIFPIETFKSKFPFHSNYQIKKKKKIVVKKNHPVNPTKMLLTTPPPKYDPALG